MFTLEQSPLRHQLVGGTQASRIDAAEGSSSSMPWATTALLADTHTRSGPPDLSDGPPLRCNSDIQLWCRCTEHSSVPKRYSVVWVERTTAGRSGPGPNRRRIASRWRGAEQVRWDRHASAGKDRVTQAADWDQSEHADRYRHGERGSGGTAEPEHRGRRCR
jgi:hypothetical protein